MATNLNGHRLKQPQTETDITEMATDLNGHKPEQPQTEMATDRKGHKPKRPQTETATNYLIHACIYLLYIYVYVTTVLSKFKV